MDKSITTGMLISISMILALLLFNSAYPAILEGADAIQRMTGRADERMQTDITIIHATGELDSAGWWQDTNGNGDFDVLVWVKNVGATRITAIAQMDIFFGPEGGYTRIPHESVANGAAPYWSFEIENGTDWIPTATLRITIHHQTPLASGRYFVKVTLPNGIFEEAFLGL